MRLPPFVCGDLKFIQGFYVMLLHYAIVRHGQKTFISVLSTPVKFQNAAMFRAFLKTTILNVYRMELRKHSVKYAPMLFSQGLWPDKYASELSYDLDAVGMDHHV